jgi:aspartyl-tRNA(Asn)/glutamyl-tRNA(Gln) amidotransferase subunit C
VEVQLSLTLEEVRQIASLARLALDDAEADRLREQLSGILDHFELLKELDTAGVQPTAHSLPLTNVMREDQTQESLPVEQVLANAPRREGDYLRVRAVFD